MTIRSDIKPGVTILVPADTDPLRPRHPYRLHVNWIGTARQPGLIAISGDLLRLDGTPTHRRNHRGRFAVLPLADLTVDEG